MIIAQHIDGRIISVTFNITLTWTTWMMNNINLCKVWIQRRLQPTAVAQDILLFWDLRSYRPNLILGLLVKNCKFLIENPIVAFSRKWDHHEQVVLGSLAEANSIIGSPEIEKEIKRDWGLDSTQIPLQVNTRFFFIKIIYSFAKPCRPGTHLKRVHWME